ncbi:hypothetical protein [Modestobacter sp. SSW1-42]|uniref:hypothetical protein n=1 Tax=Modestobacter sp. SSW1-42 TaxID=596372 RepID=UPI003985B3D9
MSAVLAPTRPRRAPRYVVFSAWAVPVMVLGQFAFLAMIPVALVLYGALRDTRVQTLRWPAGLLTAVYATPLATWLLRPDGAQSLSKDIHPVSVGLIVAASAVVLLKIWTNRR